MWYASESWHTYFLVAIIAYSVYRKSTPRRMLEFLLGCAIVVACADLSTNVIKHSVKRYRPSHNLEIKSEIHSVRDYKGGEYGFYSSHSANTFGLVTFMFFFINWIQRRYKFLLFFYPALVAYSRMYLGVHYPSDVFIGMLAGLFFGTLIYKFMNSYFFKNDAKKV